MKDQFVTGRRAGSKTPATWSPFVSRDTEWMVDGKCAASSNPDLWFDPADFPPPDNFQPYSPPDIRAKRWAECEKERRAQVLCEGCPILLQCRAYSVEKSIPFGVWGGWTSWRRLRRRETPEGVCDDASIDA